MRLTRHVRQRGDTIIEVMFATAVFSMVAIGSLSIMNQGTAAAQRSLEITLVRQQIDAQAEALRYIHEAYVATYTRDTTPTGTAAEWVKMTSTATGKGASAASPFGTTNGGRCPDITPGQRPFVLNARTATVWSSVPSMKPAPGASVPPFAQVTYNSDSSISYAYGIWIEAVPSPPAAQAGFVDFHIRACWDSAGSGAAATLGTIVRLYEPR